MNQSTEYERQREAEMFKLFEFLTGGQLTKLTPTLTSCDNVNKLTSTEDYRNDTASESATTC